ncbi:hypothetical protein [Marinoscillum sp.]|uniref:hypothetical protein n=1 Tax=Marinoscillum sp. TaxID=2024838 RepID=UPI003BA9B28D
MLRKTLMLFFIFLSTILHAQVDVYPASVMPMVSEPASVYLSDYIETGSERFTANVLFHDFNESSWTFKLKMTIQSPDVSLVTKPTFTPSTPITVMPGEPVRLSGADWIEYFTFSNLNIGGDVQSIVNSGRLPEGYYSFCLQVLDYETGDPLSEEICARIYIKLQDPPLVVNPTCNTIINPVTQVQFPITWQLFNTINPNGSTPEFQVTIWELLEADADPLSAVQNGQALQVFQSDILTNTTLNYGPSQPLLDIGKTYIYRIQAVDQNGRSYYKNNGYSQYCYFHYGYPVGGSITIRYPDYDAGFRRGMTPRVSWSRPSNWIRNYSISYELLVKEMQDAQQPEDAIIVNDTWHYRKTGEIMSSGDQGAYLDSLDIEQKYVWQVKAYASEVEVAASEVSTFFGPALVEEFYAGNSKIIVDYISNKDLNSLSGGGRVMLSDSQQDWNEIEFKDLQVSEQSGMYFLESGTITGSIEQRTYKLQAQLEDNGPAEFKYDQFRLDKNGIEINGFFEWDVPFAVEEGSPTTLTSQPKWLSFNKYRVFGNANMDELSYELFDPSGFTLEISNTSKVFINQGKFEFSLNGSMVAPEEVLSVSRGEAAWAFSDANQLGLIQTLRTQPILAFANAGIEIHPTESIIDLSDNESPGKKSGEPLWKGIYLNELKVKLPNGFDEDDQLSVDQTIESVVTHNQSQTTRSWIGVQGLNFEADMDLSGSEAYFNTFPAEYTRLNLAITNGYVSDASTLEGNLLIPFVDDATPFDFETQMYDQGFRPGTIANLTGTSFTHNADGGDLKLNVSILKSEIVDKESIRMTMDLEWPSLDISFKAVPNFMVWGNYSVGFFTPEGIVALANQITTNFRDYPVTIDALSAGRNKDQYGIAISGKVVMGEDVSGDEGAPAFNLYSLVQNGALDTDYEPAKVQGAIDLGAAQTNLDQVEEELAALEEDLNAKLEQERVALESSTADALSAAASNLGGQAHEASELFDDPETADEPESFGNIKEELIAYLSTLKEFLPLMITDDAQKLATQEQQVQRLIDELGKMDDDTNDMQDVIAQLKKFGEDFAVDYVASLGDGFLNKVDSITNKINGDITRKFDDLNGEVERQVDNVIGQVIDRAANQVINALADKAPNMAEIVAPIAASTKRAIVMEITGAVANSTYDNVVFPVTSFITTSIQERAHRLVRETAKTAVMGAMGQEGNPSQVMDELVGNLGGELRSLGDEVVSKVNLEKALETIRSLGTDAINNIEPKRITDRIMAGALEAIAGAVANAAAEKLGELANNALGDEIGIEVPVDFGVAGIKALAKGNPKELLFDPIPIKVRSPALDINGLIHFMKDHPIYGDGFAGDVVALVKKPNTFEITLTYINGRKEGLSFWMAEVGGAAASTPSGKDEPKSDVSNVGGEMAETNAEPPKGLKIGPLEIMAIRGRVYHHMSAEGLGKLTPDANLNYGAYLHLIMFGPKQGTKMRLEVDAAMSTFATGDYTWNFDGNAQFVSTNPKVNGIDENAVVKAELSLSYNSAEKHFFGFASAEVKKTGALCASGSLLIDVKPGAWRIAIGSKEEKIRFIIGCAGFGPTGWLDINQSTAFLGLGLEFSFYTSINLDVGIAAVGLIIDAGAAAGIQALVQHNPEFMIMEAGVWLELWANIILSYKTPIKKGTVNLAEIYVAADALMRFNPPPTILYGQVKGKVKVLFLNFGFDKKFEMNM